MMDIVGVWTGTIGFSITKKKPKARVSFTEAGLYAITVKGISSKGTYSLCGNELSIHPQTPMGFAPVVFDIRTEEGLITISGKVKHIKGKLTLVKRLADTSLA